MSHAASRLVAVAALVLWAGATRAEDRTAYVGSMTPTSGRAGDPVRIVLPGATKLGRVAFSGATATVSSSVVAAGGITATAPVPSGARTGRVTAELEIGGKKAVADLGVFTVVADVNSATPLGDGGTTLKAPLWGEPGQNGHNNGSGQGGPPTVASAPKYDADMDLPVEKPEKPQKPEEKPAPPPPPPPPPPAPPPPSIYGKDLKSESGSVIYVIDISGSMGWEMGQYVAPDGAVKSGCRLDRAKAELTKSVLSLPKSFKFNIEAYDCSIYECFTNTSDGYIPLEPADDDHKKQAIAWIDKLQPQGATGTGPAVVNALLRRQNKLIVLLTDGAPNCGAGDGYGDASCLDAHRSQIQSSNTQHAVINVFGIGATGDFRSFCVTVASQNGGAYVDVR